MAALDQATVTAASEIQPMLIPITKKRLHVCSRFRLPLISEKTIIIMIVWNLLFATALLSCIIPHFDDSSNNKIKLIIFCSFLFLYPIVGWLVDSQFGKYKVLQAALFFLLASIVVYNLSVFVFPDIKTLNHIAMVLGMLASVCYISCTAQFTMDQMVGASGEELSFTIYWLVWGLTVGWFIAYTSDTSMITKETKVFLHLSISSASFILAYVLFQYLSHILNTKPQLSNPITLIVQVLNYARKHKYPVRRSALTYWEEDYPSRLDLGKEKYGGPFSFEQVENVKTVARLIPLVANIIVSFIGLYHTPYQKYYDSSSGSNGKVNEMVMDDIVFSQFVAAIAALPFYHLIVHPLFHNWIPRLLTRIGVGIVLAAVYCLVNVLMELYVGISEVTGWNNMTMINIPLIYAIISTLLYFFSLCMLLSFGVEFIIAQTQHQIRGLVLCITFEIFWISNIAKYGIFNLCFNHSFHAYPNTVFHYWSALFVITIFSFVSFVYIAKKYKLRVRDDIIPFHRFVEEVFEKDQILRETHRMELGLEYSDVRQSQ